MTTTEIQQAGPTDRRAAILKAVDKDNLDFKRIIGVFSARRWLLVSITSLVVGVAALIVFQIPNLYTAEATIMLNVRKSEVTNLESVISGLPVDAAVVQSEIDVIQSRKLIGRVVDQLKLIEDPEFNPLLRGKSGMEVVAGWMGLSEWLAWFQASNAVMSEDERKLRLRRTVVDTVRNGLKVKTLLRSYSINIEYSSLDPAKATKIANAIVDTYLLEQLETKYEATRRANEWLQDRLGELKGKVEVAERAVQTYRAKNNLIESSGSTVTSQQVGQISSQLVIARAERSQAEARLRNARQQPRGPGVEATGSVLQSSLIQALRQQESTVRRKEAEMSNRYGPQHPQMINVRAELADIQGKIREETQKIITSLANEVEVAKAKEDSLERTLNDLEGKSAGLQQAEVRARQLEREAEANRTLYENFLKRFKETSEQGDLQEADARVIGPAELPLSHSYPKRALILVIAMVVGLILAIVVVLLIDWLDKGYRTAQQVEEVTRVPVLGVIPQLSLGRKAAVVDYVVEKPLSAFSEALRTLHTAIHFSNLDSPPKVLMVTSSVPSEGKTTLSACLARSLALSGRKVMLLEADLRRPNLSRLFGKSEDANLPQVLTGQRDITDAVRIDPSTGLNFLLATTEVPVPQEVLGSQAMRRLVEHLRTLYDVVLIDTPPILAVSDAAIISPLVDSTIFVVRWRETPREVVLSALKQLTGMATAVTGIVLAQVNVNEQSRYSYGEYGYYYRRYKEYYTN